jgi:hypothetical protein
MKFIPEYDEILPPGEYEGTITFCNCDAFSKAGKPKIALKIEIQTQKGKTTVFDNVTLDKGFLRKFCHLCRSANIISKYDAGNVNNEDLLGKNILCKISIDTYNGIEKNQIDDYLLTKSNQTRLGNPISATSNDDSDIPF